MNRIALTLIVTLRLLAPSMALAHDPALHKGKATVGEIVSLGADRFELKTDSATIPVTYSSKTKFEHGNAVVDKTHLQKGEKVSVIGTKLPNGDLVAKEVLLGVSDTKSQGATKTDPSKKAPAPKAKSDHKH